MSFTIRPRGLLIAAAIAVLAIGAGVAYATIPDPSGVIHGCYDNKGAVRVIDPSTGGACKNNETALNWSQTGPQGSQGPQGAQGPQGTQGPIGPSDSYTALGGATINSGNTGEPAFVTLPAGSYILSGEINAAPTDTPSTLACAFVRADNGSVFEIPGGSVQEFFGDAEFEAITVLGDVTLSSQTDVGLDCTATGSKFFLDGFMITTKVGAVHESVTSTP